MNEDLVKKAIEIGLSHALGASDYRVDHCSWQDFVDSCHNNIGDTLEDLGIYGDNQDLYQAGVDAFNEAVAEFQATL